MNFPHTPHIIRLFAVVMLFGVKSLFFPCYAGEKESYFTFKCTHIYKKQYFLRKIYFRRERKLDRPTVRDQLKATDGILILSSETL